MSCAFCTMAARGERAWGDRAWGDREDGGDEDDSPPPVPPAWILTGGETERGGREQRAAAGRMSRLLAESGLPGAREDHPDFAAAAWRYLVSRRGRTALLRRP